jgi:hypothetical protein
MSGLSYAMIEREPTLHRVSDHSSPTCKKMSTRTVGVGPPGTLVGSGAVLT